MTTSDRPFERFSTSEGLNKVLAFLTQGGVAKLGKAVDGLHISYGADLEQQPGQYVVVVPREGVCEPYWNATLLSSVSSQARVNIDGAKVSLAKG